MEKTRNPLPRGGSDCGMEITTMGNHTEQFEGNKPQEAKAFNSSLSNYGMERQDPGMNTRDLQMKSSDLVAQNILPDLAILDDVKPGYGGRQATREDLKESGVKAEQHTAKDGTVTTKVDFPNGVKVEKSETPPHKVEGKPHITVESSITVIDGAQEKPAGSGKYVDATGKQVAQVNEDGSVTVDGGKGKFFTVEADGTVTKASAIRSRDGKTFEVLDTDTPLGNLRPGDVVKPEKKH